MIVAVRHIALAAAAVAVASFAATSDAAIVSYRYSIDVGGVAAGWVHSAEGGHATSDVVTEKSGADGVARKHVGIKYQDITLGFGGSMGKGVVEWIQSMMNAPHRAQRRSGSIVALSDRSQPMTRLSFTDAIVSELTMPAVDVASTGAAFLTVKVSPHATTLTDMTKEPQRAQAAAPNLRGLSASRFKFQIDGMPNLVAVRVEALTLKQKVAENPTGQMRDYQKEPANIETPNLVVSFSEATAAPMDAWHNSFVIHGKNGQDQEKNGSISYLSEDGTTLFTLEFHGLGIFKATHDKNEAGGENIKRQKYEMYCEDIRFRVDPAVFQLQ